MYDLIEKKLNELRSSKLSPAMEDWIEKSNMWYWLYSDINLNGERVGRKEIVGITEGLLQDDTPLELYNYVHSYLAMYRDMCGSVGMQSSITPAMMDNWYKILYNLERAGYRDSNAPVYEWSYIPPYFRDVPELMRKTLMSLEKRRFAGNTIERAASLLAGILRIRPYGYESAVMARAAVLYTFIEDGFPVPMLNLGEDEFNRITAGFLENGDISVYVDLLERSMLNRLDEILLFIKQDEE